MEAKVSFMVKVKLERRVSFNVKVKHNIRAFANVKLKAIVMVQAQVNCPGQGPDCGQGKGKGKVHPHSHSHSHYHGPIFSLACLWQGQTLGAGLSPSHHPSLSVTF